MIHYLSGDSEEYQELFLAAVELEPISGARLRTLYDMFGPSYKNADFWVQTDRQGRPSAALARYGGQLSVTGALTADLRELEEFVRFIGGFGQVSAFPALCRQLRDLGSVRYFYRMARTGPPFDEEFGEVVKPPLSDVYDLLCQVDPVFRERSDRGAWHVHASHLMRHKLGHCAGILRDGKLVSTGGVYNSGQTHAVIGGLATLPEEKGQGYAGLICRYLANQILADNKKPSLYAATESLTLYYNSMGFVENGRWSEVTLIDPVSPRTD